MALTTDHPPTFEIASSSEAAPFPTNSATTAVQPGSSQSSVYFEWLVLALVAFGILANGLMLFVLAYFKKNREQPTNKLILNQTAFDLLSCVTLAIDYIIKLTKPYFTNDARGYIFCLLFNGNILYAIGLTGSTVGLAVIAAERYFKIVHVVLHRRYYRPWMLHVGIALPWIYSLASEVPASIVATIIVDGECWNLANWANPEDPIYYGSVVLVGNYILPVLIFICCYARIALVIRGRLPVNPVSVAVVAGSEHASHPPHGQHKSSAKERNVIQTMMLISLMFTVCWLPIQVNFMLYNLGYNVEINGNSYSLLAFDFICYINMVLNPVLYAWQYETVRESVRMLLKKPLRAATNTAGTVETLP